MKRSLPSTWSNAIWSLIVPLAIGLGMFLCLDLLINRQVITDETLLRYLTGHPISRVTVFLFCVGIASLLTISNNVFDQFCTCSKIRFLELEKAEGSDFDLEPDGKLSAWQNQLDRFGAWTKSHYLWRRLHSAIAFLNRSGSAERFDDELKFLAEQDLDEQQRRYSLVRIVIWATPMLGFLGTVLGISQALGGIQVGPDNDFQSMLNSLRGSLFVAFDTTALALALSMFLMFFLFFVERFESQLLETVTKRAEEELAPLMKQSVPDYSGVVGAIEKIGRTVMATSHNLVRQQSDHWNSSMQLAERSWLESFEQVSKKIRENLSESLRLANIEMADAISRNIDKADQAMASRWEQWQVTLSENARQMRETQQQVVANMETVRSLIQKIDNARDSQQLLNRNLDALAATSQLHETLASLNSSLKKMQPAQLPEATPSLHIHRPDATDELDPVRNYYQLRSARKSA